MDVAAAVPISTATNANGVVTSGDDPMKLTIRIPKRLCGDRPHHHRQKGEKMLSKTREESAKTPPCLSSECPRSKNDAHKEATLGLQVPQVSPASDEHNPLMDGPSSELNLTVSSSEEDNSACSPVSFVSLCSPNHATATTTEVGLLVRSMVPSPSKRSRLRKTGDDDFLMISSLPGNTGRSCADADSQRNSLSTSEVQVANASHSRPDVYVPEVESKPNLSQMSLDAVAGDTEDVKVDMAKEDVQLRCATPSSHASCQTAAPSTMRNSECQTTTAASTNSSAHCDHCRTVKASDTVVVKGANANARGERTPSPERKRNDLEQELAAHMLSANLPLKTETRVGLPTSPTTVQHYPIVTEMSVEFRPLVTVDTHPNGGAHVLRADWAQLKTALPDAVSLRRFVGELIRTGLCERNGAPYFVMTVVRGAGEFVPDLVDFFARRHPAMSVKIGSICDKNAVTATTFDAYAANIARTYAAGTFRYGAMHEISVVGVKKEECGQFCPQLLTLLEQCPFTAPLLPWGELSTTPDADPRDSDDGPIVWIRPGEQTIPTDELPDSKNTSGTKTTPGKRGEAAAGGRRLQRRERREIVFHDRTPCHADHVGDGLERRTTAAVGVLKAVHCRQPRPRVNRIVKDVVCFDGADFNTVQHELKLDLFEPPMSQCTQWVEEAKLNEFARAGVRYTRLAMHDDDVYFLPRNVVHQFRTVAACASLAWHVRLRRYHDGQQHDVTTVDQLTK